MMRRPDKTKSLPPNLADQVQPLVGGRTPQRDGSYHFRPSGEWGDGLPTAAFCAFCPDVAFAGTAAECFAWNQQHRAAAHPGLRSVTQGERRIAARRAQGLRVAT